MKIVLPLIVAAIATVSAQAQVLVSENFSSYSSTTGSNALVGQQSWAALGTNPSPLVLAVATPPGGGKYLEDNGVLGADTRAQKNYGFDFNAASAVQISFDFYAGAGTTVFGLKENTGTLFGPGIGYSAGFYISGATSTSSSAFAKTATDTNVLAESSQWYRMSSILDFAADTATLSYQLWDVDSSTWGAVTNLYFDNTQTQLTTALTVDPTSFEDIYIRMANNGASRITNLTVTAVPEPSTITLCALGALAPIVIVMRRRKKAAISIGG